MKKKRILFIGSLPTKKVHFNGETNKTGDIYKIFKKSNLCRLTKINLTRFKLFATMKMILCSVFFKYDSIFISKCIVGGSFAAHLIFKYARKSNKSKIYLYWIGNGTMGLEDKNIYTRAIERCRCVIFESEQVYRECGLKIASYVILPCIKPNYDIRPLTKDYEKIKSLKCIYFSRICEQKGLMDAIHAVELANKELGFDAFTLDIAGAPTTDEALLFEKGVKEYIQGKDNIFKYYGKSFYVAGLETYLRLQQYDLHLFPSHFKQECVPGSIVDMFIAGIPTVSSSFPNVSNLLSEKDSFIFKQNSLDDFVKTLVSIYKSKNSLNDYRINSYNLHQKYSEDGFLQLMKNISVL